ncbi:eukaryotic translation initiation factor 2-alpha kinase [Tribolium madens]|uniref:eukaryotic translation initiation factor 2-alpha kinase n=1 Tax=Tribolium madens TaxID=41895 RepID=UPI001CF75611|nr:eukaryotic translation initiation factor 2-alpha kinase [Tribolium madens]
MLFFQSGIVFFLLVLIQVHGEYEQLPNCLDSYVPGLVLVSTIDGKFSALSSEGALKWQVDTDPGPLLVSNIHNLELTNSGKWIRIIPSLTGALYRFDGSSIDPISISAESLLRSSFKYSDDLVIAGGLEVRTYGIGFRTGKVFYTCSTLHCINTTNSGPEVEDILLLERSTQIVRAVESQSGHEKWNFSVGHHNIKSTHVSCADSNKNLFNWNISAIIPDGLLLASNFQNNVETTWQYQFPSPIVRVWRWNGHKLTEINLFQVKNSKETEISPAIYLGMHKKQLYIHESFVLQNKLQAVTAVGPPRSLGKIPWKPIPASGLVTEDDSTAISVLYSSEYVNGHGYFLYSDQAIKQKNSAICENNNTLKYPALTFNSKTDSLRWLFSMWWKEILVTLLTFSLLFNLMFRSFSRRQNPTKQVIFVERPVEDSSSDRTSESSDGLFTSRYLNDFDTLRCLGKGGFGVVFEVKQKIDECHYAIKRIVLPNERKKREAVMREVKALAKLEHHNIVRYFNSWVEQPPPGWQEQHDNDWIKDRETSGFTTETTHSKNKTVDPFSYAIDETKSNDSFIVFQNSTKGSHVQSDKTETVSYEESHTSGVNWRRPSRRYHSLTDSPVKEPPTFLYIQMQLCQRQSLKEWLVDNKERPVTDILQIFKQIVSAVEYVHMHGLIHRDLKPSNIFFSLDGQIKVGDFGLVKDEEESHDASSGLSSLKGHTKEVGTRLYMSPEQLNGQKYNYKVDIYSLGLIFFELLVYFSTDMERIQTMTSIRDNKFPKDFTEQYSDEYRLLTLMLCQLPEKRLTTFGVRARPPLNCCDNYDKTYDFELPKSSRTIGLATSK